MARTLCSESTGLGQRRATDSTPHNAISPGQRGEKISQISCADFSRENPWMTEWKWTPPHRQHQHAADSRP